MKCRDDDDTGYILEVDLEYPREMRHLHNDYPMAPEEMTRRKICCLMPKRD